MRLDKRLGDGKTGHTRYAEAFTTPLLNPDQQIPAQVSGPNGKSDFRRYAVYRNNVTVSLINALASTFPAVKRITGEEFFRVMARSHVRETPPQSPLLFEYGRDFPGFIERYEYASSMPWLADVARIERAWLDSYHAANKRPLTYADFASISAERMPEVVLEPHPATRVLRSRFPVVSIFAMNRSDDPVGRFESGIPEDALIVRPESDVAVRHLPVGGATFLLALAAGKAMSVAAAEASAESADFDLSINLAGLIESGALCKISYGDEVENV
jgi:hypothetical protein